MRNHIKRVAGALVAAGGLLGAAWTNAAAQTPISIEDIARTPAIQSVSMSPDGKDLVALVASPVKGDEFPALASWDIDNLAAGPIAITPSAGKGGMNWIAASALGYDKVLGIGRQEWTGAARGCLEGPRIGAFSTFVIKPYLGDTTLKDFTDVFKGGRSRGVGAATQECIEISGGDTSLVSTLPADPDNVLIQRANMATFNTEYYKVNLKTGEQSLVHRNTETVSASFFDRQDGRVRAKQQLQVLGGNDYDFETMILNEATGGFDVARALTWSARERETSDLVGYDYSSGKYYVATDKFSDKVAIYIYDPRTDQIESEPVFAHDDFDASGIVFDYDNSVLGFTYSAEVGKVFWVDPEVASIQAGLEQAFPDQYVSLMNWTEDRTRILFNVSSSNQPPVYYMLFDKSRPQLIGASMPWIDSNNLAQTQLVYYTARDGLEIPAFLTLPKGWTKADGPLPSINLPHGGPWARDGAGWDGSGWPQFLASRGYAVLQPQYRGSTGWGRNLWLAGDAEWGKKMQDDKDDGFRWMVEQGYTAAGKGAIFGYSYGGFAAFAGAVRSDTPFSCAIAGAGVSNLTRLGNNWSDNRVQRAVQGRTVTGMDPLENADNLQIPILIYHGDRDVRVPLYHSKDFYNKVRSTGKAKLVVIDDMPHSLPWYPDHHRESLREIERWLASDNCNLN